MMLKKNTEKTNFHPRNPHRFRYDFEQLTTFFPELKSFVFTNEHNIETLDFSNSEAVKALNKAILISEYGIANWDTLPLSANSWKSRLHSLHRRFISQFQQRNHSRRRICLWFRYRNWRQLYLSNHRKCKLWLEFCRHGHR